VRRREFIALLGGRRHPTHSARAQRPVGVSSIHLLGRLRHDVIPFSRDSDTAWKDSVSLSHCNGNTSEFSTENLERYAA